MSAAILHPDVTDDLYPRRHYVELLTDILANLVQPMSVMGTDLLVFRQVMDNVNSR